MLLFRVSSNTTNTTASPIYHNRLQYTHQSHLGWNLFFRGLKLLTSAHAIIWKGHVKATLDTSEPEHLRTRTRGTRTSHTPIQYDQAPLLPSHDRLKIPTTLGCHNQVFQRRVHGVGATEDNAHWAGAIHVATWISSTV